MSVIWPWSVVSSDFKNDMIVDISYFKEWSEARPPAASIQSYSHTIHTLGRKLPGGDEGPCNLGSFWGNHYCVKGPLECISICCPCSRKPSPEHLQTEVANALLRSSGNIFFGEDGNIVHSCGASTPKYKKSKFQKDTHNPADQPVWEQRSSE